MKYTLFFIFGLGCAPEWVDVQDAAVDTKENLEQTEENNSENNSSSENIEDENIENDDSENTPSEDQTPEDGTGSDNTEEEDNSEDNTSDNTDEDTPTSTIDYVGAYIGSFIGGYDYGYGYVDEFCNGSLELDLASNNDVTGETICQTYQGSWTYSFEGEATEDGNDINISGTMTATDQFGSSFSTDLYGFISVENSGSYMYLEWEFPDYGIIGNADLEMQ